MDGRAFRQSLGEFATGVAVITTQGSNEEHNNNTKK